MICRCSGENVGFAGIFPTLIVFAYTPQEGSACALRVYELQLYIMIQKQGGARLRDWLEKERRTQEWLAEQIGTHQTNVSAWIRGRSLPVKMAIKIRDLTDIPVDDWAQDLESSPRIDVDCSDESAA